MKRHKPIFPGKYYTSLRQVIFSQEKYHCHCWWWWWRRHYYYYWRYQLLQSGDLTITKEATMTTTWQQLQHWIEETPSRVSIPEMNFVFAEQEIEVLLCLSAYIRQEHELKWQNFFGCLSIFYFFHSNFFYYVNSSIII